MSPTPQTPPTDRPLTAGDVPLLREGDVLRCTNPHTRAHLEGEEYAFGKRTHNAPGSGNDIVMKGDRHGTWSGIFTFVSRPATSAASEGETIERRFPALNDHLIRMAHTGSTGSLYEWGDFFDCLKAALASPPVSERERELEGALREARTTLSMLRRNVASEIKNHDGLFRWEGVPEAIDSRVSDIDRALTAQPAGEGK